MKFLMRKLSELLTDFFLCFLLLGTRYRCTAGPPGVRYAHRPGFGQCWGRGSDVLGKLSGPRPSPRAQRSYSAGREGAFNRPLPWVTVMGRALFSAHSFCKADVRNKLLRFYIPGNSGWLVIATHPRPITLAHHKLTSLLSLFPTHVPHSAPCPPTQAVPTGGSWQRRSWQHLDPRSPGHCQSPRIFFPCEDTDWKSWQHLCLSRPQTGFHPFSPWPVKIHTHKMVPPGLLSSGQGDHSSVQFSHSVVSDSLRPQGLQQARAPCPSPIPRVYSNSCPLSQWCHLTISCSVIPFSSCPQSFPASGSFQMSQLFISGGQSIKSFSFNISPSSDSVAHWVGLGPEIQKGASEVVSTEVHPVSYRISSSSGLSGSPRQNGQTHGCMA